MDGVFVTERRGPAQPERRRTRRWLPRLIGAALILLTAAVVAGLALMLLARGPLLTARATLTEARSSLVGGDIEAARRAFARAGDAFEDAQARLGNPLIRLSSAVPVVGRTPDALTAASEAGRLLSSAGLVVSASVERLPGGIGALAPRGGAIALEPLEALAGPLARARALLSQADATLDAAPRSLIPDSVARPLSLMAAEVDRARQAAANAAAVVPALPEFLGADEPKRYIVGAQNPAELRGTGGIVGSYTVMTVDRGRIELGRFVSWSTIGTVRPSEIRPPNPDYGELYEDAAANWALANSTPDFPSAAEAMEALYGRVKGADVDGTILADPEAFARLLEVTGPVTIPTTDVTVQASSVVPFVTNEAYSQFRDNTTRKAVLAAVAAEVFRRFLFEAASAQPAAAAASVIEAAADGHLLLHSTDSDTQAAFERSGLSGGLLNPSGDYLAVIGNGASGNKIDYYAERRLRYRVEILPEGWARGRTTLDLANHAPRSGQPRYVIGYRPDLGPGESATIVGTYCAQGCRILDVRRDGDPAPVALEQELGHPVTLSYVRIPSGGSARLEYDWFVPGAWQGDETGGSYRLTVRGQPLVRPTRFDLEILVPDGRQVVSVGPGMQVQDDRVTWSGILGDVTTFEVRFERPLGDRLLRALMGTRPLGP